MILSGASHFPFMWPFRSDAVTYHQALFRPLGEQGGARRLQIQPVAAGGNVKPECGDVAAFQDHLIAAVQSCNLIEQDYPALQEICTAVVLNEQLLEKLSACPRAEADIARRREVYFAARAVAGGAFLGKEWEVAVVAPESSLLPGEKVLQEFCMDLHDVFSWVYLTACIKYRKS